MYKTLQHFIIVGDIGIQEFQNESFANDCIFHEDNCAEGALANFFNGRLKSGHRQRTRLYRLAELIGKWSMVDVFVVAILVALVHLGGILEIRPGVAAISFAGVVIVTMFAAHSFDPRLIWDQKDGANV